jgi:glycosyltransferase involved in cell wall biosynthesis
MFGSILTNARHIIALTEEERKSILSIDGELAAKVVMVPNGLNLQEFATVKKINLHEKYEIPAGSKIVGFIGRLTFIKGIDISLEALSHIKDKVKFVFLIIGPDEGYGDRLKLLARKLNIDDKVIFTGILNGEEKYSTIKSCDLFLLTSRDEGLPMTVLEVAALGVPQVISSESNVPELAEYKAGYIHSIHDVAGFAKSVEKVLNNEKERQFLGQNALKMVDELFNIKKTISAIEGLMVN